MLAVVRGGRLAQLRAVDAVGSGLLAQEILEQVMVTVRVAMQAAEERVRTVELVHDGAGVGTPRQQPSELRVELVHRRRAQAEFPQVRIPRVPHLRLEVAGDQVVAAAGQGSREYMGKPISKALEDAITERSSVFANGNDRGRIPVTQEQREPLYSQIMQPIISAGDTVGSVLLLGKNERDVMGESEKMLIRTASGFLGRQMEQ